MERDCINASRNVMPQKAPLFKPAQGLCTMFSHSAESSNEKWTELFGNLLGKGNNSV